MKSDTLGQQLAVLARGITLMGLLGCGPSGAQAQRRSPIALNPALTRCV